VAVQARDYNVVKVGGIEKSRRGEHLRDRPAARPFMLSRPALLGYAAKLKKSILLILFDTWPATLPLFCLPNFLRLLTPEGKAPPTSVSIDSIFAKFARSTWSQDQYLLHVQKDIR
jgi:hypothetical protein